MALPFDLLILVPSKPRTCGVADNNASGSGKTGLEASARPYRSGTGRTIRWDADAFRFVYGRVDAAVGPGDVIIVPPAVQVVSGYDLTKDLVDIAFKIALSAGVVAGIG